MRVFLSDHFPDPANVSAVAVLAEVHMRLRRAREDLVQRNCSTAINGLAIRGEERDAAVRAHPFHHVRPRRRLWGEVLRETGSRGKSAKHGVSRLEDPRVACGVQLHLCLEGFLRADPVE